MPKIKEYFSNLGDKVKTSVRVKSDAPFFYLTLVLIILVSILIRMPSVVMGNILLKEFDVWIQYNSTSYILRNGLYDWMHWMDYQQWFPEGYDRSDLRPGLLLSAVFGYKLITALGINIPLIEFVFYWPAFMGGLSVFIIYFLGKEIMDKRTGLMAAFFLALSPGSMQRTVTGFFDNETVGVLAVLLTFLFYLKAVKSGNLMHGFFAGLSLGYLCLSWGALTFPLLLVPLLTLVLILADKYSNKAFNAYIMTIGVGLLVYSLYVKSFKVVISDMDFMIPALFFIFLLAYQFFYLQKGTKGYENIITFVKWAAIPVGVVAVIIFFAKPEWIPFNLGPRLSSILNPKMREDINLVASVGEHMPSPWSVFYYNALIPILLVIPGIYFAIRRGTEEDLLMIIFVLTLFYFTGSMIRIILLFAPAVALIGAYGLINIMKYFGNLMKKEQTLTRRRRRQLKRTVGISEGLVVYAFIGVLLFTQANHAITISTTQLGYSELVAGGTFHDWEESLTWMSYNLPSDTVVVSWWDYGYWLRVIGNVTVVNDNGTLNSTRLGLTGMAMMQTNERYSAEIFRQLHADYVVVYFGHLYSGLGGDEGKWPWMLRICNDHTSMYEDMGLVKDNWYGGEDRTVDTVFDEAQYINETSGLYRQNWFDTTLVKLMLYDEPTTAQNARTQTEYYYATQIEGSTEYSTSAKTADDGRKWSEIIPTNGAFDLEFFEPAYYSSNKLVKMFKVDYTALDSSFSVIDTELDLSGIGSAKIMNTGITTINLKGLQVNGVSLNMTNQGTGTLAPNETKSIWFDTYESNQTTQWTGTKSYTVSVDVEVENEDGSTYSFSNSSSSTQIIDEDRKSNIKINKELSYIQIDDENSGSTDVTGIIAVENTGSKLTKIVNFTINDPVAIEDTTNPYNNTYLIEPGQTQTFHVRSTIGGAQNLSTDANVTVFTADSGIDQTALAYNKVGHKLSILSGDVDILPEEKYMFNYDSDDKMDSPIGRYYSSVNDQTVLWDNGTLELTVRNDGNSTIAIQGLIIDDVPFSDFTINNDAYWPKSAQTRVIKAQLPNVTLNKPVKIMVLADGGDNKTFVASDSIILVPRNPYASVSIINSTTSYTAAFTNETIRLMVKNTGSTDLTLTSIKINNTLPDIPISDENVTVGSRKMAPSEIAIIQVKYSGLNVNLTNIVEVMIKTNITNVNGSISLDTRLPKNLSPTSAFFALPDRNLEFTTLSDYYTMGTTGMIRVVTYFALGHNITVDGFYIGNTNVTSEMSFVPLSNVTLKDGKGVINSSFELDYSTAVVPVYIFELKYEDSPIKWELSSKYWIVINTIEGYQATVQIEIIDFI